MLEAGHSAVLIVQNRWRGLIARNIFKQVRISRTLALQWSLPLDASRKYSEDYELRQVGPG